MSETTILCPTCEGRKTCTAFVDGTRDGRRFGEVRQLNCFTCGGAGAITAEHAERIRKGEEMRQDRLSRGLSGREEAKRLGITPQELNRLEHGRLTE